VIDHQELWHQFSQKHQLTDIQHEQFEKYYALLIEWNKLFNLTTITELDQVLNFHFSDSLMIDQFSNLNNVTMIADVGTGPGFPGLPLKIKYSHLKIVLIEVTYKKIQFLERVIQDLHLENVEIYDGDWRTFLRTTSYPIDIFCARASLQTEELLRMFQPSSPYRNAQLVYWASVDWKPSEKEKDFIEKVELYQVGNKKRALIFMKAKNE
jgi:16S rRNA (guanine527-N7)-methyltransferase